MADVFLSDVHLRLDRPERGRRLAHLVDRVKVEDRLIIVGDLCDFWFASRQVDSDPRRCEGLRSLLDFRAKGGSILLLLGNHDAWLGPYYERLFDLTILAEPCDLRSGGQRVRLAHGHQLKSKMWWKRFMEGREFLETFRRLPKFVAELLQAQLELVNERTRRAAELRMIAEFEAYCRALPDPPDVVVFGHVHRVHDSGTGSVPRLVVLGDWTERSNFLSIADDDVTHSSLTDEALGQNLRVREARF